MLSEVLIGDLRVRWSDTVNQRVNIFLHMLANRDVAGKVKGWTWAAQEAAGRQFCGNCCCCLPASVHHSCSCFPVPCTLSHCAAPALLSTRFLHCLHAEMLDTGGASYIHVSNADCTLVAKAKALEILQLKVFLYNASQGDCQTSHI